LFIYLPYSPSPHIFLSFVSNSFSDNPLSFSVLFLSFTLFCLSIFLSPFIYFFVLFHALSIFSALIFSHTDTAMKDAALHRLTRDAVILGGRKHARWKSKMAAMGAWKQ
jgi:hypothetical protein